MIRNCQILIETIINSMNQSGLDVGTAYFILKDVFTSFENLYYAELNKECLEEHKKEAKEDHREEAEA